jgi:diaminohydroxyphosphoribosylaminopyrimidine deaminase/5-amino-6-(5-phosphoribosylamino)uracil reductase
MARALRLAERGLHTTQPNPRVGCVVAHGAQIVGEGWHARAGEPHAEVFALRAAGERARGATAYVTLEPCAHFGRTPPCADALVAAGVARVVAACEDPNPKVAGGGFAKARAAGIAVDTGLLRDAARELNRGFFSRMERGRPWLRVKLAMSLDGRTALANGASKWISGEAARTDVQRWRARSCAIMTGIGTVLADDPRLTVRVESQFDHEGSVSSSLPPGEVDARSASAEGPESARSPSGALRHLLPEREGTASVAPLRVILDGALRTRAGANVLDGTAPTLVLHASGAQLPADERFARVELMALGGDASGRIDLDAVLRLLAERGINELQVEAGPTLCGALFAAQLVDELLLYVAPVMLGDGARPLLALPGLDDMANAARLRVVEQRQVGGDLRLLLRR